jgi:Tfp pilus assembly protein PilF
VTKRVSHGAAAGILAIAILALYSPSLSNPLIWDDAIHVDKVRADGVSAAFERVADKYRRPMVLLSYRAQDAIGLGSPAALHGANAVLHATNSLLVYVLALTLGTGANVAIAGAALFAFHPLQSAAVAYVSGRTDLLATLFTLVAILMALRSALRGGSRSYAYVAVAASVAAALSKESGLVAGPLAAGALYCARKPGARLDRQGMLACVLASLVVAPLVIPPAARDGLGVALGARFADAGTALVTYARLLVWPTDLHLDRLTPVAGVFRLLGVWVVLAVVLATREFLRRPTPGRYAFFAASLAYLPVAGLFPIYPALAGRWVFTPEHGLYLALAALAPVTANAVAAGATRLAFNAPPSLYRWVRAAPLALAPLAAFAWTDSVLHRQSALADEETVYRTTLAHSPSPRACFNLGVLLLDSRRDAEAVRAYEDCIRVSPNDAGMYVQLGVAYQRIGERNKAEIAFAKAVELAPGDPLAWSNYANLDAAAGFYADAREKWDKALEIDPAFAPALEGLQKLELVTRERAVEPSLPPLP